MSDQVDVTVLRPADLQPGDVLLVQAPQPQNAEQLQALTQYLQELATTTGCSVFYAPPLVDITVGSRDNLPADAQELAGGRLLPVDFGPGSGLTH